VVLQTVETAMVRSGNLMIPWVLLIFVFGLGGISGIASMKTAHLWSPLHRLPQQTWGYSVSLVAMSAVIVVLTMAGSRWDATYGCLVGGLATLVLAAGPAMLHVRQAHQEASTLCSGYADAAIASGFAISLRSMLA
jgi:hypothetical protein